MAVNTTLKTQTQGEVVAVLGEAVRRVQPEVAEFLIEITASAPTGAQAMHDSQMKMAQLAQAITPLGVLPADVQSISLNVYNLHSPAMGALAAYGGMTQIGAASLVQPEIQPGMFLARNILRVYARDPKRLGEVLDTVTRIGAAIVSPPSLRVADESGACRAALEAAGRDARSKAETLAAAVGKQAGDAVSIAEEIVVSNGAYTALRSAMPFIFGAGAPAQAGELEYYARVSATFRLQ